jgi:glycosyltransferase involved in cell wall biosynthesis
MTEEADAPPAITVVIPCFNLGRFLDEAVQSVLVQTMQDFEVIVVDDGSTDDETQQILQAFERPKTRVLRRTNHGLAATRNYGIRQGRGRYVCCLDADDRLRPDFFARAFAILEGDQSIGLVTGHFEMFGERSGPFRMATCAFPEMLSHNQAIAASVFRRAAWEEAGGYCETFNASGVEDWDLWITMLERGYRAEVIPAVVCDYRIHSAQMSTGMYEPETWRGLNREIVLRHRRTYEQHLPDVIAECAAQWADLRRWADGRERARAWWEEQSNTWRCRLGEGERQLKAQQARIADLERGNAWLEGQRTRWQTQADEGAKIFEQQQAWIAELQRGNAWLEEQRTRWQAQADEGARIFEQQQAWIAELERGKAWLEEQRAIWQRLAEELGRLPDQQPDVASPEGRAADRRR